MPDPTAGEVTPERFRTSYEFIQVGASPFSVEGKVNSGRGDPGQTVRPRAAIADRDKVEIN